MSVEPLVASELREFLRAVSVCNKTKEKIQKQLIDKKVRILRGKFACREGVIYEVCCDHYSSYHNKPEDAISIYVDIYRVDKTGFIDRRSNYMNTIFKISDLEIME